MYTEQDVGIITSACVQIENLLPKHKTFTVVVEGADGTGKTTVASTIFNLLAIGLKNTDIGVCCSYMPKFLREEIVHGFGDLNMYGRALVSGYDAMLVTEQLGYVTEQYNRNIVILDRHVYFSSMVYNIRHLNDQEQARIIKTIKTMYGSIIEPDLVVAMTNKPFVADDTQIAVMQQDVLDAYDDMWASGSPFINCPINYVYANEEVGIYISYAIRNIKDRISELNE